MSGTKEGGRKTRDTVWKAYGNDYYRDIGRQGGLHNIENNGPGVNGFGKKTNPSTAGAIGGKLSRRTRVFDKSSALNAAEIKLCVELAGNIWDTAEALGDRGEMVTKSYPDKETFISEINQKATLQQWEWIFADSGLPIRQAAYFWGDAIVAEWAIAIAKIVDTRETVEDMKHYRALRTLARAYDISNFTNTAWYQRAKRLFMQTKEKNK